MVLDTRRRARHPRIGVSPQFGGLAGSTFKHSAIVTEEAQRAGMVLGGLRLQVDICMPYFLSYATDAQRERWLAPARVRRVRVRARDDPSRASGRT